MPELNNIWKEIKALQDKAKHINCMWNEQSKDKYDLIEEYSIEQQIKYAKSKLIDLAIERILDEYNVKNVSISDKDKESFKEKDFDENAIKEHIVENYIKKADELAFKEILSRARELVPRFWKDYEPRKPTIDDIVKNKKLVLRVYWYFEHLDWNTIQSLNALEKLMYVVVMNTRPSQAEARIGKILNIMWDSQGYAQARHYIYVNGVIDSFRIYKNGKAEFRFHKEEDAKKVAEVLLSENINYDEIKSRRD